MLVLLPFPNVLASLWVTNPNEVLIIDFLNKPIPAGLLPMVEISAPNASIAPPMPT